MFQNFSSVPKVSKNNSKACFCFSIGRRLLGTAEKYRKIYRNNFHFFSIPQVSTCNQMSSTLTKRALEPYVSRSASVLKGRLIPLVGRCLILGSICGCAFGRPTVAGWSRGRIHGELRAGPRRSSHA